MKTATESLTPGVADGRTRDRVARLLLTDGPSTAAGLGQRLGLSPAAIRRHLDAMLAAGTITPRAAHSRGRRGRGRPAKVYALTDAGHAAAGPVAYEELAASALRQLGEVGGDEALLAFAAARAADLERHIREVAEVADEQGRPEAVAAGMTAAGYAASVSRVPSGIQICQHHCPVAHVAERFPMLCDAETAALARVLDSHVQRLATIAHGDGVCTTHIPTAPDPPVGPGSPPSRATGTHSPTSPKVRSE
ncbi:MAG: helix-turn-helix transcriptional regulator [Frankia sp.]